MKYNIVEIIMIWLTLHLTQYNSQLTTSDELILKNVVRQGTIKNYPYLNATADAIDLRQAMSGLGTDEEKVINIMTKRSNWDRQQIAAAYKNIFGKGLFTDLDEITGVLCSKNNDQIAEIKRIYLKKYAWTIQEAIKSDTTDPVLNLYLLMLNTPRQIGIHYDQIEEDAKLIMATDIQHLHADNLLFKILTFRSKDHIVKVLDAYQRLAKNGLHSALDQDISGAITKQGKAVRTVKNLIECYSSPPRFYAQQIYNAVNRLGTRDRNLFRPIIARSEIDLEEIKNEFREIAGMELQSKIEEETSGSYKKVLRGILEGNKKIINLQT
ncbi:annexin A5-like isoform X3 [Gordionus sp. m RMFG-2023]|uniref:annexin A5-like isoform X3 n=1 Tax=Gordionus sp. m RMFG-2023 TaxID=3053472 RepID=UPI0031FC675C